MHRRVRRDVGVRCLLLRPYGSAVEDEYQCEMIMLLEVMDKLWTARATMLAKRE